MQSGNQPSAPSAPLDRPPLVPLEAPFVEGKRYRLAPATEWPSRLDLYVEDPNGNTVRKHGVLMAVNACSHTFAANAGCAPFNALRQLAAPVTLTKENEAIVGNARGIPEAPGGGVKG